MAQPRLIICPGFHPPELTEALLQDLSVYSIFQTFSTWVLPTADSVCAPLSGYQIRQGVLAALGITHLSNSLPRTQICFLAFSAGCLGAVAAAHHWHSLGGNVGTLLALDGWGVALAAPFPVSRLSHDHFTHTSSKLLGSQGIDFYADPAVSHYDLWRCPSQVRGWQWGQADFPVNSVSSQDQLLSPFHQGLNRPWNSVKAHSSSSQGAADRAEPTATGSAASLMVSKLTTAADFIVAQLEAATAA